MRAFSRAAVSDEALSPEQRFQRLKTEVHRQLVEAIDLSQLTRWSPDRLRGELRELAEQVARERRQSLGEPDCLRLVEEVINESFGLGPLEALMNDPTVSDILVNGPNTVYVERGGRLEETNLAFADNAHLMRVIQRVVSRVGRRVDESSPLVDARLPDGSRVNAVVPPLALDGAVLSIRRFGVRFTDVDLIENGTMTPEILTLLRAAVEARINLIVSGGTGAGKTTMLNCLSRYIPGDERVVTVEDSAELLLQQPHVVRMETRPPNLEGAGEVTARQLVRNALRMRPDRIIVGEVRGPEVLDMLQAMNTGHEGSLTTIHANDTRDALARMELMATLAGFDLPVPVLRDYIAASITLIVQLARLKGGPRKVLRVCEVGRRMRRGSYSVRELFGFRQLGVRDGLAFGEFYATGKAPRFLDRLKASGIELPPDLFARRILAAGPKPDDSDSEVQL